MRGALSFNFRRFRICCSLIAILFFSCVKITPVHAAGGGLDLARDTVSSILPDLTNIYHAIYFTLPVDAQQVTPTDWLIISLPNYRQVDASNLFLTGAYGSPTISQTGNNIYITNFSLLPGSSLSVNSLVAQNPDLNSSPQVVVTIAQDKAGTSVQNQVILIPTTSTNFVSVSATIISPTAGITISGYTSSTTFTSIIEAGSVIGTTVSDGVGYFSFSIGGLIPGNHSYLIYSTDNQNRSSSQSSLNLYLLANSVTSATGLLLSPSISLGAAQIHAGDTLTISGSAVPSSQINIFLESPLRSYTTTSDSTGNWSYTLPSTETSSLTPGSYRVYALVQDSNGNQSIFSPTVNFLVVTLDNNSNPPPACNISHGDLNCDGKTNLTDFSILLYHWGTNHKVADINSDGIVNLVDFSIMMFYYK